MKTEDVDHMLREANDLVQAGQHEKCLSLVSQLKSELLADKNSNPSQVGWVRYYQFKCLYALKRNKEAYDLLTSNEAKPFLVDTTNAAWMYSVGAEIAKNLNLANGIVDFGRKCLSLREQMGAEGIVPSVQGCQTFCSLLAMIEREDLNQEFADRLIKIGKDNGADRPIISGYAYLLANAQRSKNKKIIERLQQAKKDLEKIKGKFEAEALAVISKITF